jgi:hypothetical protein
LPIPTYAAEKSQIPAETRNDGNNLNWSTEKIAWKKECYHVRSQDIRRQCDVQNIGERIKRRKHKWNENVSRMAPERIVRSIRDNSHTRRRSPAEGMKVGVTFWKQQAS